ncbi:MAG TPA: hypothetical protein VM536_22375, partial [Chloroflexia bacterium]|nr:hypothetical protein [Chloroflexia bacterium]
AGLVRAWAGVLLSYLCLGAVWFQPWYITWLIPMLALLPPSHLRRGGLLLTLTGTLVYAAIPHLPGDATANLRGYYVPAILFVPPAVYGLWSVHQARRLRAAA